MNEFETPEFLIDRAIRNAGILAWVKSLNKERLTRIRDTYADILDCPLDEIVEDFNDPESLDFLWQYFKTEIRLFNHDR